MTMAQTTRAGLNDSGKEGATRIFTRGALHYSQGQRTSRHAHYAWKIHVGIDAPVWLESTSTCIRARDGARVIIVPPGVEHSTGAVGWSTALFLAPGTRGTPWRAISGASAMGGAAAGRIVQACRELYAVKREATPDVAAELARLVFHGNAAVLTIDARVENALELLRQDTGIALPELARRTGISLDRLSRLTTRHTRVASTPACALEPSHPIAGRQRTTRDDCSCGSGRWVLGPCTCNADVSSVSGSLPL